MSRAVSPSPIRRLHLRRGFPWFTGITVLSLSLAIAAAPPTESAPGPDGPPAVTPHRITTACERLLEAERIRISLPAGTMKLQEAIRIASIACDFRIDMDWPALDIVGIQPTRRVVSNGSAGPVDIVLRQLFASIGDAWERPRLEATPEGLLITTRTGARSLGTPIAHPIGDLLIEHVLPPAVPPDPRVQRDDASKPAGSSPIFDRSDLRDLVLDLCDSEVWEANGGNLARLRILEDFILVDAPPSIQIMVARLLDQMRTTRPEHLEIEASLVRCDPGQASLARLAHAPGAIAVVRSIADADENPPLVRCSMDLMMDETSFSEGRTDDLFVRFELTPIWDEDRQVVMATIRCEVLGDAAGGERRLEGRCELRVPVGGLVLMLPAVGEQPPLALLLSIRSR